MKPATRKALYIIILSIQMVCMFMQRFATMMHVFASISFNDTVEKIKHIQSENKIKRLKKKSHTQVVKKLGMACSYPGTFESSVHSILTSSNYKSAVLKTIKAGGCNCSRVNFIGAYYAALKGVRSIPKSWVKKTDAAKRILRQN